MLKQGVVDRLGEAWHAASQESKYTTPYIDALQNLKLPEGITLLFIHQFRSSRVSQSGMAAN